MPMLERTAATLEPCSLHKVLPSVPKSTRSRRQLHTAFWNHGASSVELFGACQVLVGNAMDGESLGSGPAREDETEGKRADVMTASAFVLDFLYPRGSLSLLRRLNRITLDGYEKPTLRFNNPLSRFKIAPVTSTAYSRSAAPQRQEEKSTSWEETTAVVEGVVEEDPTTLDLTQSFSAEEHVKDRPGSTIENAETMEDDDDWDKLLSASDSETKTEGARHDVAQITNPEEFDKFLALRSWGMAETVWDKFGHLPSDEKDRYTLPVLRYVALSNRLLEPQRYLDLLSGFSPAQWTSELVDGAIRAALSLDDFHSALRFGGETLDMAALVHGFDMLLTHCLEKEQWDGLIQVWDKFRGRLLPTETAEGYEVSVAISSPKLPATVAISDLPARLDQFWEHLRDISLGKGGKGWETLKLGYRDLIRYLFENSMDTLQPTDAAFIAKQLRDPILYQQLIEQRVEHGDKTLAATLYETYRQLPDVKIRVPVLRAMLDVYFPHNDRGMEMVLKDWYGRYEYLDYYAYGTFIRFYSRRGDAHNVMRLWKEYKTKYGGIARRDKRTVAALVHVFAVRGEVDKSRRVLEEISTAGRSRQAGTDMVHMNMLLNGYAKARDFKGALDMFARMCQDGKADGYSFGTLMGMTGSRGNIQLTFGLYKLARDMGIKPNASMVDAMIEGYCQNDRISDAEQLAKLTTQGGMLLGATQNNRISDAAEQLAHLTTQGQMHHLDATKKLVHATDYTYTVLWNTILDHYAERHDLDNLNRVLQNMRDLNVPFDGKTYEHILQALVYTEQANQALALVRLALQNGIFIPGPDHYTLLMSAFIKVGQLPNVLVVSKMMRENNHSHTADTLTRLMEAFTKWAQLDKRQRQKIPAQSYLAAAFTAFRASLDKIDGENTGQPESTIRSVSDRYARMIKFIVLMKDFATVPEILKLFETQFPEHATSATMPLKLLNALIRADFYEKKFDKVKEAWNVLFERFAAPGRLPELNAMPPSIHQNPKIQRELRSVAPGHKHLLNEALSFVIRVYEAEQDEEGLKNLILTVQEAGFVIGQRNWNYYVQSLVRVGSWADACKVCEDVLMPNWQGWARRRAKAKNVKNKIPLNLRRLGQGDTYMRPNTHTLLPLIKQYMELENMAVWSSESARLLDKINETCPRLVRAAKTMVPTGSDLEKEIFGGLKIRPMEGESDDIIDYVMKRDGDSFRTMEESMEAYLAYEYKHDSMTREKIQPEHGARDQGDDIEAYLAGRVMPEPGARKRGEESSF